MPNSSADKQREIQTGYCGYISYTSPKHTPRKNISSKNAPSTKAKNFKLFLLVFTETIQLTLEITFTQLVFGKKSSANPDTQLITEINVIIAMGMETISSCFIQNHS
ncbi:MAG: hypothetical protein QM793_14370 [Muricomes sp.]